mmetsp:Transcript_13725/g.32504  ORF Transcript_13725/g.32504 Transcript_13725/m.32504 type:complete len:101 (+) Transcript_13725:1305-1607(+)
MVGKNAFGHWGITSIGIFFSWPSIPRFGKVTFALSFSGICIQYAINFAIPFLTRGFGLKQLEKLAIGSELLTPQEAQRLQAASSGSSRQPAVKESPVTPL